MAASVKVRVRLDKRALDQELRGRTGSVGQVIAAMGGQATREIKGVFRERAGGSWWRVSTSIAEAGSRGTVLTTIVHRSRPHTIVATKAPDLVFTFPDGTLFRGRSVNHPGSSPPVELVLLGMERAGRRMTFTRAAPVVTST